MRFVLLWNEIFTKEMNTIEKVFTIYSFISQIFIEGQSQHPAVWQILGNSGEQYSHSLYPYGMYSLGEKDKNVINVKYDECLLEKHRLGVLEVGGAVHLTQLQYFWSFHIQITYLNNEEAFVRHYSSHLQMRNQSQKLARPNFLKAQTWACDCKPNVLITVSHSSQSAKGCDICGCAMSAPCLFAFTPGLQPPLASIN